MDNNKAKQFVEKYQPKDIMVDGKSMTIEEFQAQNRETRTVKILEVRKHEYVDLKQEGVEINGGYEYDLNGNLAEVADGLAKLAIEMDKDKSMGDNAGGYFITLISQFYARQSGRLEAEGGE